MRNNKSSTLVLQYCWTTACMWREILIRSLSSAEIQHMIYHWTNNHQTITMCMEILPKSGYTRVHIEIAGLTRIIGIPVDAWAVTVAAWGLATIKLVEHVPCLVPVLVLLLLLHPRHLQQKFHYKVSAFTRQPMNSSTPWEEPTTQVHHP